MIVLPVVERELRVAARRPAAHWTRVAAAVVAVAVLVFIVNVANGGRVTGHELFTASSIVLLVYAAGAGLVLTSDSISEEKRDGTIELLFLTDLTGGDIVLGKLAATCVNTFYGMLGVAPVIGIAWILGGVTAGAVIDVMISASAVLVLTAAIGLASSSLCRDANRALALAVGGAVVMIAGLVMAERVVSSAPLIICATFFVVWSIVRLTSRYVPSCWQDFISVRLSRREIVRQTADKKLLEINPFLWRAAASRWANPYAPWIAVLFIACLWAIGSCWVNQPFDPTLDMIFLVSAAAVLKAWLAGEASCTFSDDRRSGAMELLLSSPFSPKEIIAGQRAALFRQFAGPVAALLVVNFYMTLVEISGQTWERRQMLIWSHAIVGGCMVCEMLALTWVGMWLGLTNRKPNRAALMALARILALPFAIFFAAMFIFSTAGPMGKVDWAGLLVFPSLLGLATNFFFALEGNARLHADFRTVVSEGIVPKTRLDDAEGFAATPLPAR